jgi:hypothetical protein
VRRSIWFEAIICLYLSKWNSGVIPAKRRFVHKRSETQHTEEDNDNAAISLGIFSDSQQSSDEEDIKLTRKTRKTNVIRDNEEDESGGEEWDVDKSGKC